MCRQPRRSASASRRRYWLAPIGSSSDFVRQCHRRRDASSPSAASGAWPLHQLAGTTWPAHRQTHKTMGWKVRNADTVRAIEKHDRDLFGQPGEQDPRLQGGQCLVSQLEWDGADTLACSCRPGRTQVHHPHRVQRRSRHRDMETCQVIPVACGERKPEPAARRGSRATSNDHPAVERPIPPRAPRLER
jgi:hypothetical protein